MMNPALQVLNNEHEVILAAVQELQAILDAGVEKHPPESIREFLDFFFEYGDNFHHQKEEGILFEFLSAKYPDMGGSIIAALEEHHEMFRELIATANENLDALDFQSLSATLTKYISDLQDHISAEDDELFIAVTGMLDEREWERLNYQFEDRDRELGMDVKLYWESRFKTAIAPK